jgi:hypothetical protein
MVNNYAKMRWVNAKIKKYLFDKKIIDTIWLTPHTRWSKDITIDKGKFDGIAMKKDKMYFVQFKSNTFPKLMPYINFVLKRRISVLLVRYCRGGKIEHKEIMVPESF